MEMIKNKRKVALVTGANSGIGFEAAYQLAEEGYDKIILGVRSKEKGLDAKYRLVKRSSKDLFDYLVIDTSEIEASEKAAQKLLEKGEKIDLLVLNAGMSAGANMRRNSDGYDLTFASTLVGHHVFTTYLLNNGGLADDVSIIIAGSEAASGFVPGINLPDLYTLANSDFNGDPYALLNAYAKGEYPEKYETMNVYALAKLIVAWWASELAAQLPKGMSVNAVSPGSVPLTNFSRDMPWVMRKVMLPLMKVLGPITGTAQPISKAARRYIEVAGYGEESNGKFFASAPKKMVGKLFEQKTQYLQDRELQEDGYRLVVEMTGGRAYSAEKQDLQAG